MYLHLSVIGEDAAKVNDTFTWAYNDDEQCIDDVLGQFGRYCQPRTQVIYERYTFNKRNQAVDESISAYVTDLRTIANNCAHKETTPDGPTDSAVKEQEVIYVRYVDNYGEVISM